MCLEYTDKHILFIKKKKKKKKKKNVHNVGRALSYFVANPCT